MSWAWVIFRTCWHGVDGTSFLGFRPHDVIDGDWVGGHSVRIHGGFLRACIFPSSRIVNRGSVLSLPAWHGRLQFIESIVTFLLSSHTANVIVKT